MSDDFDTEENDSEGIKSLRKQFEAQKKELAELRAFREATAKSTRQETVAGILKAKKIPTGAAKFYDGEDISEDAVGKWLEAHADVFQVESTETQTEPQTTEPDANTIAAQRVMQQSFGTPPADAGTRTVDPIEKERLLRSLPTEELVKLGWIPDPVSIRR